MILANVLLCKYFPSNKQIHTHADYHLQCQENLLESRVCSREEFKWVNVLTVLLIIIFTVDVVIRRFFFCCVCFSTDLMAQPKKFKALKRNSLLFIMKSLNNFLHSWRPLKNYEMTEKRNNWTSMSEALLTDAICCNNISLFINNHKTRKQFLLYLLRKCT